MLIVVYIVCPYTSPPLLCYSCRRLLTKKKRTQKKPGESSSKKFYPEESEDLAICLTGSHFALTRQYLLQHCSSHIILSSSIHSLSVHLTSSAMLYQLSSPFDEKEENTEKTRRIILEKIVSRRVVATGRRATQQEHTHQKNLKSHLYRFFCAQPFQKYSILLRS